MSTISSDDVRKVAQLARLALPEDKITTYTGQLERILDYVAHLDAVDTEGVPPTTRAVEVVNVTREDRVEPTPVRDNCWIWPPSGRGISSGCPASSRTPAERICPQGPQRWGETAVRCSSCNTLRREWREGIRAARGRSRLRRFLWLRTPRRMS
jgi:aspartyl-tRNA(Asn)/glutamyl-tRNA(Gln) amidotransferase subunit C